MVFPNVCGSIPLLLSGADHARTHVRAYTLTHYAHIHTRSPSLPPQAPAWPPPTRAAASPSCSAARWRADRPSTLGGCAAGAQAGRGRRGGGDGERGVSSLVRALGHDVPRCAAHASSLRAPAPCPLQPRAPRLPTLPCARAAAARPATVRRAAQVRRALENTCVPLGDDASDGVLTYGRGLVQVGRSSPELSFSLFVWASSSS